MPAIQPILLTFPGAVEVPAKLQGLDNAHRTAQDWYAAQLGSKRFELAGAIEMPGGNRADYGNDTAWGAGLAAAGFTWSNDQFYTIFVDTLPVETAGLGGGSTGDNQLAGAVVKDGDCVLTWKTGPAHALWNDNVGMLCHEIGHALNANNHENPDGNNIEWEWNLWPNCVIADVNKVKLLGHRIIVPPVIGKIRVHNDYNGLIFIRLYHPHTATEIFATYQITNVNEFPTLEYNGDHITIGNDWGVQIAFGNGATSRVRQVGAVSTFADGFFSVEATRIYNG